MFRLIAALCLAALLAGCFSMGGGPASYNGFVQRNGMFLASWDVDNSCMSPKLKAMLGSFERKFGRKVVLTSGYRDPIRNILAGGEDASYHTKCMAADIYIPGVDKRQIIAFAMKNPQVGGLGCYPGRNYIHLDVRERPRGRGKPITFSGC
jgi:zinc D-Ala-D-Ala carboxypeptidase